MITNEIPYAGCYFSGAQGLAQDLTVLRMIKAAEKPTKPDGLRGVEQYLWDEICIPCWKMSPDERLSAEGAVEKLRNLQASEPTEDHNTLLNNATARNKAGSVPTQAEDLPNRRWATKGLRLLKSWSCIR